VKVVPYTRLASRYAGYWSGKKKQPGYPGLFVDRGENRSRLGRRLDIGNDVAKDVTNGRSEQRQNDDDDYGDQNEDKRVLNKTLTFFFRSEQHCATTFPYGYDWGIWTFQQAKSG
jgi:hypothetical protein